MSEIIIVMGVSGSGKSSVGQQLADRLNIPFFDADDFHPQHNINKMSAGIPLTDDDRLPWLLLLANKITEWEKLGGAVLACSALKESYRELLKQGSSNIQLVYLQGDEKLLLQRLNNRAGHFMKANLLTSQLETLEAPANAITVNIDQPLTSIVNFVIAQLNT